MTFQALRGTSDLFGEDLSRWQAVEHAARMIARRYGYHELRTPIIEDAALFQRAVGATSDIVQKEMFAFKDRGDQEIVLRPEGTAAVVRAYLEHNLHKIEGFSKLFYVGPMFRAERPQAGRFRQFHQYGVEAIGSESPWVDIEVITLCLHILRQTGVQEVVLWLSTMGCRDDQVKSAQTLRARLEPLKSRLCEDCQKRFERNIFRVLDCKNPTCQAIVQEQVASLPRRAGALPTPFLTCEPCAEHFDTVRRGLTSAGIAFDDTKVFARGLDYYTRTVFEVRAKGLGAQDAVAAGGRYDHLIEEFGGPPFGAVGFAAGLERVLMAASQPTETPTPARRGLYLAVLNAALMSEGLRLAQQVRQRGGVTFLDYEQKSLKAQLREADKAGCRLVAILGDSEAKAQAMTLKDLEQGTQESVAFDVFAETVLARLNHASSSCHK